MVAQLKSLPTDRPHTRGEGLPAGSRRLWVWGANAAILIAIAAVVLIRWYRVRAARRAGAHGAPP